MAFVCAGFIISHNDMPFHTANFLASTGPVCIIHSIERRRTRARQSAKAKPVSDPIAPRTARHDRPRRSPGVSSTLLLWWIQTQVQTDLGFFSPIARPGTAPAVALAALPGRPGDILTKSHIFACAIGAADSIIVGFPVIAPGRDSGRACRYKQEGQVQRAGRSTGR